MAASNEDSTRNTKKRRRRSGSSRRLPEGHTAEETQRSSQNRLSRLVKNTFGRCQSGSRCGCQNDRCFLQGSSERGIRRSCRKLAGALARKRPSPLLRGKLETWASGIVRTIGRVNFLDDSSGTPHLKLPFIDRAFGVAESTGQGKSQLIRKMLRIHQFDHRWTLPSMMDDNPLSGCWKLTGF